MSMEVNVKFDAEAQEITIPAPLWDVIDTYMDPEGGCPFCDNDKCVFEIDHSKWKTDCGHGGNQVDFIHQYTGNEERLAALMAMIIAVRCGRDSLLGVLNDAVSGNLDDE